MPNVNVSVPAEMRAAMLERPDVNWSEVARRAFTAELAKPKRDILDVTAKQRKPPASDDYTADPEGRHRPDLPRE